MELPDSEGQCNSVCVALTISMFSSSQKYCKLKLNLSCHMALALMCCKFNFGMKVSGGICITFHSPVPNVLEVSESTKTHLNQKEECSPDISMCALGYHNTYHSVGRSSTGCWVRMGSTAPLPSFSHWYNIWITATFQTLFLCPLYFSNIFSWDPQLSCLIETTYSDPFLSQ